MTMAEKIVKERQELEKHLNSTLNCLTTKKIDNVYWNSVSLSQTSKALAQQRKNIAYVVGNSTFELEEYVKSFTRWMDKKGVNSSANTRMFQLDISKFLGLSTPGQVEKLLIKMLDAMSQDSANKGVKTVLWIDADRLEAIVTNTRRGVPMDLELLLKSAQERFANLRLLLPQ